MYWVYLSPHLDDVSFSCGGLVWEQTRAGHTVEIWTLCAGDPPPGPFSSFAHSLHTRWKTGREAVAQRRMEDAASCACLHAGCRHWSVPDCIYRTDAQGVHLYASEAAIFGPLHASESELVEQLAGQFSQALPAQAEVVVPIGVGQHVDHRLMRAVSDRLSRPLWYYAEVPYIFTAPDQLDRLSQRGWERVVTPLAEQAVDAWADAFAAHASQMSTFWGDRETTRAVLSSYARLAGGAPLWRSVR